MVKLVGIAGGSGSGKSTLAIAFCRKYPETYALIHVDDYFKHPEDAPKLPDGNPNWDDPTAVRFDDIIKDIHTLFLERSVSVCTKSELYNPAYSSALKNKISYIIEPRPVILLEGYLALYDQRLRNLMSLKIYLDIPIEESLRRRSANKSAMAKEYFEQVVIPAHRAFVEPAKQYADLILDTGTLSPEELFAQVEVELQKAGV